LTIYSFPVAGGFLQIDGDPTDDELAAAREAFHKSGLAPRGYEFVRYAKGGATHIRRQRSPLTKGASDVIGPDAVARLRDAGYVVVHQEPTAAMIKAGGLSIGHCEGDLEYTWQRMTGVSVREQKTISRRAERSSKTQ
jgi:hypothetical protein